MAARAAGDSISGNQSLMIWGRKKALTKNHLKVKQEMMNPQAQTQEQCQFLPRSKFLKKLTTVDRKPPKQQLSLNKNTLKEYSSKKTDKDKVVMDWMSDIEREFKQEATIQPFPTPSGHKIHFKSETGKRWADRIQNTTLQAPNDSCKKHHVPRRLLTNKKIPVTETTARIEAIWNENQCQHYIETKVGMIAMANTGERTPIAGMTQIVCMLHESLKLQERKSDNKIKELELLLKEERKKRESAELSIKKSDSLPKKKTPVRRPLVTRTLKK